MSIKSWVRRAVFGFPAAPGRHDFVASGPMPIDNMFSMMRGWSRSVSREEALRIPGVLKGRNLLCSVATLPLTQRGPGNRLERSPLLEQIDPNVTNVVVLAMTLEDLLFDGVSWWRVTARGADGYPSSATHIDRSRVTLKPPKAWGYQPADVLPSGESATATVVYVDGKPVLAADMIRFDSPNPALLQYAGDTFRAARMYLEAAGRYASNPMPTEHFTPADNAAEPTTDQVEEFLSQWKAARRSSSTAYVPGWAKYNPDTSTSAADMKLPELKTQAALETALCMGLDPEVLGVATTSRTYANAQDWRRDRINDLFAGFMLAITQRLSMGDVTRRGYLVTFDVDDYMRADPITRTAYYRALQDMGAIRVEQIQEEEGLLVSGDQRPTGGTPAVTPGSTGDPARDEVAQQRARRAATFDAAASTRTFEFRAGTFSVDTETRTVRGLALPYNKVASKYGLKFKFAPGSLEWGEQVSRVKFLREHMYGSAIGVATKLENTPAGLDVAFRVGQGADRDAVLADAADGILDGLSVGVEFDEATDTVPDPDDKGVLLVRRATLREVSITAMPAFDDARVTTVAASRDGGSMNCTLCGAPLVPGVAHVCATAPAAPVTLTADQFAALLAGRTPEVVEPPAVVDPAGPDAGRQTASTFVNESTGYAFNARPRENTPGGRFVAGGTNDFSTDVAAMLKARDFDGQITPAGRRVLDFVAAQFDVDSADINETTPTIQRPDMYVDQRDYRYPLWDAVNKGTPPNGIQPFTFPKFSSASGLVGAHTEGTEPTGGTFVTTGQTVTPTAVSGKAYMTREAYDMGGNPAVSTLIWNQMVRGYKEGLETATSTFLATLTAATDLLLTAAAADDVLMDLWEGHVVDLQFIRGYDFDMFAVEKELFKKFAQAEDSTGRPLNPMLGPMNTNGTAARRFVRLDLAGVEAVPSWALASTAGAPNNSWLFDRSTVHGWATAPQRLEFEGASDDNTSVAPVAKIGFGIWGYTAFANSDIGGVRQVIYDTVA